MKADIQLWLGVIHNRSILSLPGAYSVLLVLFQACHDMLESVTSKEKERKIFISFSLYWIQQRFKMLPYTQDVTFQEDIPQYDTYAQQWIHSWRLQLIATGINVQHYAVPHCKPNIRKWKLYFSLKGLLITLVTTITIISIKIPLNVGENDLK